MSDERLNRFEKYLNDVLKEDSFDNSGDGGFRVNPRWRAIFTQENGGVEFLEEQKNYALEKVKNKSNLGQLNYDANINNFFGKEEKNTSELSSLRTGDGNAGPFFYNMAAGTFGIGGVEFDFKDLSSIKNRKEMTEILLIVVVELLLFINDMKGNTKQLRMMESYISNANTIPQGAIKDIKLPVLDSMWAYPGPIYPDKKLPYTYKLMSNEDSYCGKCYFYVGEKKIGKCHRWNNAVVDKFVCGKYKDRNVSFHDGDFKGKFKATDEVGKNIQYHKGDVVFFQGKTYIATQKTNAELGSPIHNNSGWNVINESFMDGGEF